MGPACNVTADGTEVEIWGSGEANSCASSMPACVNSPIIATLLAVGTLCWRMGAAPMRAYMTGAVAGVVVYLLFTYALNLALPLGVFSVLEGS